MIAGVLHHPLRGWKAAARDTFKRAAFLLPKKPQRSGAGRTTNLLKHGLQNYALAHVLLSVSSCQNAVRSCVPARETASFTLAGLSLRIRTRTLRILCNNPARLASQRALILTVDRVWDALASVCAEGQRRRTEVASPRGASKFDSAEDPRSRRMSCRLFFAECLRRAPARRHFETTRLLAMQGLPRRNRCRRRPELVALRTFWVHRG